MKKRLIFGLTMAMAMSMSAQTSLVKEVERGVKGNGNSEELLAKIQPALTNPETAELAETWVVAGKAGFGFFQDAIISEATGQPFDAAKSNHAAKGLLDGFNYYLKALPLDSVADNKGKIKTKFSKEIVKTIKDRYDQLRNAGIMAWSAKDFDNAYNLWEMWIELPSNPVLGKNAPKAAADTIVGETMWNQAIALLLQNKNQEALTKLTQMEPYGFIPEDYYSYAMGAAQAIGDDEAANNFARKGMETCKGGAAYTGFIAQLINTELAQKNYEAAYKLVNDALASTTDEQSELRGQLYNIMGNINENNEKFDEAEASFRKSIEIDPNFAKSYFDLGRIIYNNALKIDETIADVAERDAKVAPMLLEAAGLFEKAYGMDDQLSQIPSVLYRLYYRLGNGYEDKMNYWQNM